jgi:DNA-binding MarR family transcriptional regulator
MTEKAKMNAESGAVLAAFFTDIAIIDQLAYSHMERVLPDGMLSNHYGVLNHMVRLDKIESPAELASAFQVSRPSMTNTIQKLQAKGYVTIEPDPKDGRGKLVKITEDGRDAHKHAQSKLGPAFERLLQDLGLEVFLNVRPDLEKIRAYMDENRDF